MLSGTQQRIRQISGSSQYYSATSKFDELDEIDELDELDARCSSSSVFWPQPRTSALLMKEE